MGGNKKRGRLVLSVTFISLILILFVVLEFSFASQTEEPEHIEVIKLPEGVKRIIPVYDAEEVALEETKIIDNQSEVTQEEDMIDSSQVSKIKVELNNIIKDKPQEKVNIIIRLNNKDKKPVEDKIKLKQGKLKESLDDSLIIAELEAEDLNEISDLLNVESIWPNRETKIVLDKSVEQINTPYLWNLGYTGKNIKIAILDTGISKHDMFKDRIILERDFTGENDPNDYHGHGTHVAGIVAGSDSKYKGVAPDALLLNGKVLDNTGSGRLSWLINGIDWAIQNNVDVISLSLGASYKGEPEELLSAPEVLKVEEAISRGIIVVIASGNCNQGCGSFFGVTTPGIARNAITIGAVDDNNLHADFSSGDSISDYIKPDLVAPGVDICSSYLDNGYSCLSGTSMSTPHVAGASALLLEKDNSLNPLDIKSLFEWNALDLGIRGKDVEYGSGLIDLSKLDEPVKKPDYNNYEFEIPLFEIGQENEIIFTYKNVFKDYKKFEFVVNLEDLDDIYTDEFKETIPYEKSKSFDFEWKSSLIGKHLLTIDVYSEDRFLQHIEVGVSVSGGYIDSMSKITNILVR